MLMLPKKSSDLSHAYLIEGNVEYNMEYLQQYLLEVFGIIDIYQSIDVSILYAEEIGVSEVRELVKGLALQPYGNQKIYLILHADKLSDSSQNALLKTIEEPSKNTIFFLLTNNSYKLLPTILSRTVNLYHSKKEEESEEESKWIENFLIALSQRDLIVLQHSLEEIAQERSKAARYLECLMERVAVLLKESYTKKNLSFDRVELLEILSSIQRSIKFIKANVSITTTLDLLILNILEGIDWLK